MTALTPSHKRIRAVDTKEKEGEISDEYEDADVVIKQGLVKDEKLGGKKQGLVKDEKMGRKRKRDLTNSLQSKSAKIEAEPFEDEELLTQEDLNEEEVGLDEKETVIKEQEGESTFVEAVNISNEEEGGQRMLTKSVADGKEDVKKFDNDDQEPFEQEILDEEDEMLAYLWPGSARRSVL